MLQRLVLIFVVGISMQLINPHVRVWRQAAAVSWAGESEVMPGKVFRDRLKSGVNGPELVVIPAGKFRMGDVQGNGLEDERPVRDVHIQSRFAVSRYEITFAQYDKFADSTGRELPKDEGWGRGRRPVINITWQEARDFAAWLSKQTGERYRLPSEAEWEYAARAGTETAYWWGNHLTPGMANCYNCGSQWDRKKTAPVGSFRPNKFGLYDTSGNVIEWIQDCMHGNYNGAPTDGSAWLKEDGGICNLRGVRGSNWRKAASFMRSSARLFQNPKLRRNLLGFRLVREIE